MSRTYKDVPYWVKLKRNTLPDIAKNIKKDLESDFYIPIKTTEITPHISYVKNNLPHNLFWGNRRNSLNVKNTLFSEKVKYNQYHTKLHTNSFIDVDVNNTNNKNQLNEISFALDDYRDKVVDMLNDFIAWNVDNIKDYSFSIDEDNEVNSSRSDYVELTDINFKGFYLSPSLYRKNVRSFLFDENFVINFVTSITDYYKDDSFETHLNLDVIIYYMPSIKREGENNYSLDYKAYDYELSYDAHKNSKFDSKYNLHSRCKCYWCEANPRADFKDFPYSVKKTQANIELNKLKNSFNSGGIDELEDDFDDF